jgi:hypothetical protein
VCQARPLPGVVALGCFRRFPLGYWHLYVVDRLSDVCKDQGGCGPCQPWGVYVLLTIATAYVIAIVIVVLAFGLAARGYLSIHGEFDAVLRAARRIVAVATAAGARFATSKATVTIVFQPPSKLERRADDWLVIVEAEGTDVIPKSQLVTPSQIEPTQLVVFLKDPGPDAIDVAVSVYDAATLSSLGRLDTVVPAARRPTILGRLRQLARKVLGR